MDRLALSFEGIRYYAYSVIRFQIPQMSRRSAEDRHLHLISFIVYQTFKLQDILIDTLLSAVQAALNATEKEHKNRLPDGEKRDRCRFPNSSTGSGTVSWGLCRQSRASWSTSGSTDEQKVAAIDAALHAQEPRKNTVEQRLDDFERNMTALHQGRDYYALLEDQSLKLGTGSRRLSGRRDLMPSAEAGTLGSDPALPAKGRRRRQKCAGGLSVRRATGRRGRSGRQVSHIALQGTALHRDCQPPSKRGR